MSKIFKIILIALVILNLFNPKNVIAVYNPTTYPNNKIGIHLSDSLNFEKARELINSSGGDWGYVTFVVRKDERDTKRWQKALDEARRNHLIPIVRIATRPLGDTWEKPSFDEIDGWVDFLSSLNWVIENRYIIIGNEPNHAKEWGGEINPEEYATYVSQFSLKLKNASPDFFVLGAGLDASAPNSKITMDESLFIRKMLISNPSFFEYVDGWVSHSYPNPAFSGSEYASGKGTVKTFEWEINYLETFGVKKDLPIFITATGWIHDMDPKIISSLGKRMIYSFTNVWNNPNVVCVTPFILDYSEPPFDAFSWIASDTKPYSFFLEVKNMPKIKGVPNQETLGKLKAVLVNPLVSENNEITGIALAENMGQSIWNTDEIKLKTSLYSQVEITSSTFLPIEPFKMGIIIFNGKVKEGTGLALPNASLVYENKQISNAVHFPIVIFPKLWVKITSIFGKIGI